MAEKKPRAARARGGRAARGARILLVEDSPTYRELATLLLEAGGHTVIEAPTAEEGLRLAREAPPDMIVMDTNLPGMDGFGAVRELKRDARTRHIPVVGLTADRIWDEEQRERARAAGFDQYAEKPVDREAFRELLRPFL
ncbi:MAG TPA: response regulator [Gemmatimonadales bacterium]